MFFDDRYSGIIVNYNYNVFYCEKKDANIENGIVSLAKPIQRDTYLEYLGKIYVEYGRKIIPIHLGGNILIQECNKPSWAKRTEAEAKLRYKRLLFQETCNNFFLKLLRKRSKKRRMRKKMLAVLKALKKKA